MEYGPSCAEEIVGGRGGMAEKMVVVMILRGDNRGVGGVVPGTCRGGEAARAALSGSGARWGRGVTGGGAGLGLQRERQVPAYSWGGDTL